MHDGVYPDKGLLKEWPESGPKLLRTMEGIGRGYSSASVTKDRVYITGMLKDVGYLFAFDLKGKLIYKVSYGKEWSTSHPGARTTPVVADGKVYVESGMGNVVCFKAADGKELWRVNILETFGGRNITWGMTESVLIEGGKVICTPGGPKASVVALAMNTGKTIWTCKEPAGNAAYCSPGIVVCGKNRMVVTMTTEAVMAIAPATGELIWLHPYKNGVQPNTPFLRDGHLFCSSGYGKGSVMIKLSADGTSGEEVWTNPKLDIQFESFGVMDGYIYGTGHNNKGWHCLDWKTGKLQYTSMEFAKGSIITADGMFYCYSDKGVVALVEPDPKQLKIVGSFMLNAGDGPHWAHPVINGGNLYVRHGKALLVYSIKQ